MSRFFISYSHADKEMAAKLRKHILDVDSAHDVFLDRFGLTVGSHVQSTIVNRIEWCDYFLLVLTEKSLASKWVNFELQQVRKSEQKSGAKKLFVIQPSKLATAQLPKSLANDLILEFSGEDSFPADFFRLMYGIYQRPTFYSIGQEVKNDPIQGYLFSLYVKCESKYLDLIDFVEYRFDYEFDDSEWNQDVLDTAVGIRTNRKARFRIGRIWTNSSVTVFVGIYLKNTRVVYLRAEIDLGSAIN
jgi:hypothetical protein